LKVQQSTPRSEWFKTDLVRGEKLAEVLLPGFREHRQIAAVDHLLAEATSLADKVTKLVIHLRRAACDIECVERRACLHELDTPPRDFRVHHFSSLR
jgi:hypothetical protein